MKPQSPIEDMFLTCLEKHIAPGLKIRPQENIETAFGMFRVDFLVMPRNPPGLVFECDGAAYHTDAEKDLRRDAALLSTDAIKYVWRLSGGTIFYTAEVALHLVSLLHPRMFSERGLTNLAILGRNHDLGEPEILPGKYGTVICTGNRENGFAIERHEKGNGNLAKLLG